MTQRTLSFGEAPVPDIRTRNRARAEAIKAKVSIADLAELREARVTPQAHGYRCDCPTCHGVQSVRISAHGEHFACEPPDGCGLEGDLIAFEMAAGGASFARACANLEAAFNLPSPDGAPASAVPAGRDDRTGELFS